MKVNISGREYILNCYVVDLGSSHVAILGYDELYRYGFLIDPKGGNLRTQSGHRVPITHSIGNLTGIVRNKGPIKIKGKPYLDVEISNNQWKAHPNYKE